MSLMEYGKLTNPDTGTLRTTVRKALGKKVVSKKPQPDLSKSLPKLKK
jgi:hypothetical protein